jgi:hypothetical protein
MGSPVEARASEVEGILFIVRRVNFGDEFPWSKATKATEAGGGKWCSKVG